MLAVAQGAAQLPLKMGSEKPAVIKPREWVGGRVDLEPFQLLVLHQNGYAKLARRQESDDRGAERDWLAQIFGQLSALTQDLFPIIQADSLGQIQLRDGPEEPLQEVAACGAVQVIQRFSKQFEQAILGWIQRKRSYAVALL